MSRLGVLAALALVLAAIPAPSSGQRSSGADGGLDVEELTVADVEAGLRTGTVTSTALVQAFLTRIDRYEATYNAFISMSPDALRVAAALDAEYARSGSRGPLHGVPVVIKDNMDQAGVVTTAGFEGFSSETGGIDMIPDDDAVVVRRLRDAGAVILGKTNLPDFARDGTRTRSSVAGTTLNSYGVDRAPGGSSGGTATAVSASFAVLGLGTETGGSIQNPAAAQGLVGVKPTYGLVPLAGVVPLAATYVDVVGPLARTVRDAAVALDVIAGPAEEDPATFAAVGRIPDGGYLAALEGATVEGRRFGLVGPGWRDDRPLDARTDALYRDAVSTLVSLGAEVVEDPFGETGFAALYEERPRVPTQWAYDMRQYLAGLGAGAGFHSVEEWEALSGRRFPGPLGEPENGAAPVLATRPSATEEGDAYQAWRLRLRELFRAVMARHELDGLFFPQAATPGRPLVEDPSRPDYSPNNWPEIPSNVVNDLGVPVVTLPYGYYEDGTPFVLAFIGDAWTEADLLGYASVIERVAGSRRSPRLSVAPGG